MPIHLLKPSDVKKNIAAGTIKKYPDGAGLYLHVRGPGSASWVYQYRFADATHWLAIGPAATFTADEAREIHHQLRRARDRGIDPREALSALAGTPAPSPRATGLESKSGGPAEPVGKLFGDVAAEYLETAALSWKGGVEGKEASIYKAALLGSSLAKLPVNRIATADVEEALFPWLKKPVTGERVRRRIKTILDHARAKGYRSGENPARFEGHFEHLSRPKAPEAKNHPAMPSADVPAFMAELLAHGSREAQGLAFLILTAARTSEVLGMRWREIAGDVWIIPGGRMKEGLEHRVPLTPKALALLGTAREADDLVFPGRRGGSHKPIWKNSFARILKALRGPGLSVHGFRSTFAGDWGRKAGYPTDLTLAAIAHVIGKPADRAYLRPLPELAELRRPMMEEWTSFALSEFH